MALDFSKTAGCYTKNLTDSIALIKAWYFDSNISHDCFVQRVHALIAEAKFNAVAKPRFLAALLRTKTKDDALQLCYNSLLSAKGLAVC